MIFWVRNFFGCSFMVFARMHKKSSVICIDSLDKWIVKNRICFENTPCCIPVFLLWQIHHDNALRSQWNVPNKHFLTSWPWPLTYDLDLLTWPRYPSTWLPCQNSSSHVCSFGRESGNRQTHRHTQGVKTITPDTSQMWGVYTNMFQVQISMTNLLLYFQEGQLFRKF